MHNVVILIFHLDVIYSLEDLQVAHNSCFLFGLANSRYIPMFVLKSFWCCIYTHAYLIGETVQPDAPQPPELQVDGRSTGRGSRRCSVGVTIAELSSSWCACAQVLHLRTLSHTVHVLNSFVVLQLDWLVLDSFFLPPLLGSILALFLRPATYLGLFIVIYRDMVRFVNFSLDKVRLLRIGEL